MRCLFLFNADFQKFEDIAGSVHIGARADRENGLVGTVTEILAMNDGDLIFLSNALEDLVDLGIILGGKMAEDQSLDRFENAAMLQIGEPFGYHRRRAELLMILNKEDVRLAVVDLVPRQSL